MRDHINDIRHSPHSKQVNRRKGSTRQRRCHNQPPKRFYENKEKCERSTRLMRPQTVMVKIN